MTLPGVHEARHDGGQLSFDVDGDAMPHVMRELSSLGVTAITATPPTLEQLLLRHYGDELAAGVGNGVGAGTGSVASAEVAR
jgi:ABC-2 type transport system ATP-binding protein